MLSSKASSENTCGRGFWKPYRTHHTPKLTNGMPMILYADDTVVNSA